jgi:hypothetical protein
MDSPLLMESYRELTVIKSNHQLYSKAEALIQKLVF